MVGTRGRGSGVGGRAGTIGAIGPLGRQTHIRGLTYVSRGEPPAWLWRGVQDGAPDRREERPYGIDTAFEGCGETQEK